MYPLDPPVQDLPDRHAPHRFVRGLVQRRDVIGSRNCKGCADIVIALETLRDGLCWFSGRVVGGQDGVSVVVGGLGGEADEDLRCGLAGWSGGRGGGLVGGRMDVD